MIEINIPEVVAEVEKAFARYERALVSNDIAELDALFWKSPHTLRYGVTENLYGYDEIAAFRGRRPAINLARDLAQDGDHHLRAGLRHRQRRVQAHRRDEDGKAEPGLAEDRSWLALRRRPCQPVAGALSPGAPRRYRRSALRRSKISRPSGSRILRPIARGGQSASTAARIAAEASAA